MDKLNENFEKLSHELKRGLTESYYRFLTVANLAINKMARPAAESAFAFIDENIKIEENKSTDLSENLKKSVKQGIKKGHKFAMEPLEYLGGLIKMSENELSATLKDKYGIRTNQWMFSRENFEVIEKINMLVDITFPDVRHLSNFTSIRYLTAWTIIQRLYRKYETAQIETTIDSNSTTELKTAHEECIHYVIFANAIYGHITNFIQSGDDIDKLVNSINFVKEFVLYTKIKEEDILSAVWEATPILPAYVIARNKTRNTIVVSLRGSNNWADFALNLDFSYLGIDLMKDDETNDFYLKFNFEESQSNLKQTLGDTTKEKCQTIPNPGRVIDSGLAHSGLFALTFQAFKEITPKLEEIFAMPEHQGYNLVVTGHGLGGGMATLLTFLYLVHPLSALKGNTLEKLRGYSYGGMCVLSSDFEMYMKGIMKSVVFGDDVIPRLSYGSIKDICRILLMFEQLQKEEPDILKQILSLNEREEKSNENSPVSKSGEKLTEVELYHTFKAELNNSVKLSPMGRTIYIEPMKRSCEGSPLNEDQFILREITEKEIFEEIIFSDDLIKHHFPHVYEEGLFSNRIIFGDD